MTGPFDGVVRVAEDKKRYRCTKGHEWTEPMWVQGPTRLAFVIDGEVVGDFCLRCLGEFMKANIGMVLRVPAEDTPLVVPAPTEGA